MSDEGLEGIVFQSGGQQLIGTLFSAWGPGPKPTALLLHGLPGIEKNHDMALIVHPEANHSFTRHRAWLFQTLLDWLSGLFQEPL